MNKRDEIIELERFYSPKQVAEALGVCKESVYAWVESGALGATKVGKIIRIGESDYRRFTARLNNACQAGADMLEQDEPDEVLSSLPLDCLDRLNPRHEAEALRRLGKPV